MRSSRSRYPSWTRKRRTQRVGRLALPNQDPAEVPAENLADRLIPPVYQGDGRSNSRDARVLPTSPPAGTSDRDLSRALELIVEHEQEIRDVWARHFGS